MKTKKILFTLFLTIILITKSISQNRKPLILKTTELYSIELPVSFDDWKYSHSDLFLIWSLDMDNKKISAIYRDEESLSFKYKTSELEEQNLETQKTIYIFKNDYEELWLIINDNLLKIKLYTDKEKGESEYASYKNIKIFTNYVSNATELTSN